MFDYIAEYSRIFPTPGPSTRIWWLHIGQTLFREVVLPVLRILIFILLFLAPLSAIQAATLTDIEQIQEKTWYLQRDLAAQKEALEKTREQLRQLTSRTAEGQAALEQHLVVLETSAASQQESLAQVEQTLLSLQAMLDTLNEEISKQINSMGAQAEHTGSLEKMLRALKTEVAAYRTGTEQALAKLRIQLDESHAQLEKMRTEQDVNIERLSLWAAGAALVIALLLTIGIALHSGRAKSLSNDQKQRPRHDL